MAGHGANDPARLRNFREWIRRLARWVATFEKAGDGSGAGGLDENSFVRGEPSLGCENLVVSDDVDGLTSLAVDALSDSAVRQRLADLGQDIPARERQTPQALASFHRAEIDKWWPILKAANIKID